MEKVKKAVKNIIKKVNRDGDEALIEFTSRFDGVRLGRDDIEVNEKTKERESSKVDRETLESLKKAAKNIKEYAAQNYKTIPREELIKGNGVIIRDRYIPVKRAGLYVPGGEFSYPSSVLMTAIFAQEAGVKEVVMMSPPGKLTPEVIKAAQISGVDRIFRIGGAQAIAAMALGTESVPGVDIIVGPGNMYVQEAKKELSDKVGIDMLAGPSEVVIIAHESKEYSWLATDLMAQAEHAPDARAVLVTPDKDIIENVKKLIIPRLRERVEFKLAEDIGSAVNISNRIAPEHLQIICPEKAEKNVLEGIYNAGAVFVGKYTPVALGDYWAGPSHTLPTGMTARYSEGLNVRTFLKKVSFMESSKASFQGWMKDVERLAGIEGMEYHKKSVSLRRKNTKNETP